MVKSQEDLEAFLNRLERRFEHLDDGTYLVAVAPNQPPVAVRMEPPVLLVQVKIGAAPSGDPAAEASVFRRLLELNASDLLHAGYGLDGATIVLSAALELDNLDLNELEATLADVAMALAKHVPVLREMVQKKA